MSYPVILDGAMGTELQNRGVEIPLPLWSADANINHPDIITSIHTVSYTHLTLPTTPYV